MRQLGISIKTDLKVLAVHYKKLLFFAMQMSILCLAIGMAGSQILYANKNVQPFTLAIVDLEASKWTDMIIDTVNQMETVTKLCDIEVLPKEEAKEKLSRGQVTAIITIPEHFVEDIMNGVNTPLTIEKKDGTLLESIVADELISAAAKLLSAAQAGIYTTLDAYETFGTDDGISFEKLMQEINIIFAKEMLGRHQLFEEQEVVATKNMAPLEHYILSGFIAMMLLSLMLIMEVIEPLNKKENLMRYSVVRLKPEKLIVSKVISLSLFNLVSGGIILGSVAVLSRMVGLEIDWHFSIQGLFGIILGAISLASVSVIIGMVLKGKEAYSLFIFVIVAVMTFLSGGIIPAAYLPEAINEMGRFTYNDYALELLKPLVGIACEPIAYIKVVIIIAACLMVGIGMLRRRGVRG